MASVLAIRNSSVLEFTPNQYLTLISKNPKLATSLFKLLIDRLRKNAFELNKKSPAKNIAILTLQENNELNSIIAQMKQYFKVQNTDLHIFNAQTFHSEGKNELFLRIENQNGLNILLCDKQHFEWSSNA